MAGRVSLSVRLLPVGVYVRASVCVRVCMMVCQLRLSLVGSVPDVTAKKRKINRNDFELIISTQLGNFQTALKTSATFCTQSIEKMDGIDLT